MVQEDPEIWTPFRDKVKHDFAREIGAHTSALLSYYPRGGFVGWHTNWNANAYQVLFTYSETGNSYFRYYDKQSGDIITLDEKPGGNVTTIILEILKKRIIIVGTQRMRDVEG